MVLWLTSSFVAMHLFGTPCTTSSSTSSSPLVKEWRCMLSMRSSLCSNRSFTHCSFASSMAFEKGSLRTGLSIRPNMPRRASWAMMLPGNPAPIPSTISRGFRFKAKDISSSYSASSLPLLRSKSKICAKAVF